MGVDLMFMGTIEEIDMEFSGAVGFLYWKDRDNIIIKLMVLLERRKWWVALLL